MPQDRMRAEMENRNTLFIGGISDTEAFFSLFYEEEGFLSDLGKSARRRKVPVIRPEMEQLLQLLLRLQKPQRILEIGTAIAYSALLMSRFLPASGKLLTIERNPVMQQEAVENIEAAKAWLAEQTSSGQIESIQPDKIELRFGDAAQLLPELKGTFDFIFLDSAKAQYIHFLPELVRLLPKGGLLVTDNVLQNGEIMLSRHLLPHRERTTHKRMRQYLREVGVHPQLTTHYFGVADGATVSIKRD